MLIISVIIIFSSLAAFIQSFSGFGYSLFIIPFYLTILPAKIAIPLVLIQSIFVNLLIASSLRTQLHWKGISILLLGGIMGMPVGIYFLSSFSDSLLKSIVGCSLFFFGILLLADVDLRKYASNPLTLLLGMISGMLNGSISMSGPPVIVYFLNHTRTKNELRHNLVFYFLILNVLTAGGLFFAGNLFRCEIFIYSFASCPGILIAFLAGRRMVGLFSEDKYRKTILVFVLISGLWITFSGWLR